LNLNGSAFVHGVLFHPSEEVMKNIISKVQRFLKSEDGPTAVEYAIMLALIVIVCLTAIQAIGDNANTAFNTIATEIAASNTTT
jgi:pilus assembly protein Flp/PilA